MAQPIANYLEIGTLATGNLDSVVARALFTTLTAASTKVIGARTTSTELECSRSKMAPLTLDPSKTIAWLTGLFLRKKQHKSLLNSKQKLPSAKENERLKVERKGTKKAIQVLAANLARALLLEQVHRLPQLDKAGLELHEPKEKLRRTHSAN